MFFFVWNNESGRLIDSCLSQSGDCSNMLLVRLTTYSPCFEYYFVLFACCNVKLRTVNSKLSFYWSTTSSRNIRIKTREGNHHNNTCFTVYYNVVTCRKERHADYFVSFSFRTKATRTKKVCGSSWRVVANLMFFWVSKRFSPHHSVMVPLSPSVWQWSHENIDWGEGGVLQVPGDLLWLPGCVALLDSFRRSNVFGRIPGFLQTTIHKQFCNFFQTGVLLPF